MFCFWSNVIAGVHIAPLAIGETSFDLVLIGRKAVRGGGTLSQEYGSDENGNCGGYVEVEQILSLKDHLFAHVQLRGSVPLNWTDSRQARTSKLKIRSGHGSVLIYGENEAQQAIFDKHLEGLQREYEKVCLIDLLSTKSGEGELHEIYRTLAAKALSDNLA